MAPRFSRFAFASARRSLTGFAADDDDEEDSGALANAECVDDDDMAKLSLLLVPKPELKVDEVDALLPPKAAEMEPEELEFEPKLSPPILLVLLLDTGASKSRSSSPPQLSSPQPLSAPALSDVDANAEAVGFGGVMPVRATLSFIAPPLLVEDMEEKDEVAVALGCCLEKDDVREELVFKISKSSSSSSFHWSSSSMPRSAAANAFDL